MADNTAGRYAYATIAGTVVPAANWKIDADAKLADASNFRDGRRKTGTLDDGTLSLDLVWDPDEQPTDVAVYNLRLGSQVTVKCYVDGDPSNPPTKFFQFPGVVGTIGPASAVEGDVVRMPVTLGLNGTITYPA